MPELKTTHVTNLSLAVLAYAAKRILDNNSENARCLQRAFFVGLRSLDLTHRAVAFQMRNVQNVIWTVQFELHDLRGFRGLSRNCAIRIQICTV